MSNPYIVGSWVQGKKFYDRRSVVSELLDQRHQCIYLIGNRRMGKTSILRHLEQKAEKETSEIPLFLDLQGTADGHSIGMGKALNSAIRRKVRKITELWEGRASKKIKKRLNKHIKLSEFELEENTGFCNQVKSLTAFAESHNLKILLLMDETEKLLSFELDELETLRAVLHESRNLRAIFAASKSLGELNAWPWKTSPLLHGFTPIYISSFSDKEARNLVCQSNKSKTPGEVAVEPTTLADIMRHTGNHPFLIQYLCDRIFVNGEGEGRLRPVESKDLIVDEFLAYFFQSDYNSLSHSERRILHQLSNKKALNEGELKAALGLPLNKVEQFLYGLENLGFICFDDNQYRIANTFFEKWLQGEIQETQISVSDEIVLDMAEKSTEKNIAHAKNILSDSSLSAGRDAHVGDKNTVRINIYMAELKERHRQLTQRFEQSKQRVSLIDASAVSQDDLLTDKIRRAKKMQAALSKTCGNLEEDIAALTEGISNTSDPQRKAQYKRRIRSLKMELTDFENELQDVENFIEKLNPPNK